MEEGKEMKEAPIPFRTAQSSRSFPLRLLQFFLVFLIFGLCASMVSMYMIRHFGIHNKNLMMPLIQSSSCYKPCFKEKASVESWIRPPPSLIHSMNDTELFWRATFVPAIKDYPYHRVPRIAFMFLTKGPLPLAPLWERFFKGHEDLYSIYVHSPPSYHDDYSSSSVFYRRQVPSQVTDI
ncbi:uncharacterized protein LOC114735461 [Neltuma alba]|uniref:uncharacterized protein LOC114735461 n=1 Tax=Neltuma alba TaxID=207710 RepID=UPI0010A419DF|nr:uncharacterized protein LOC114735461 [Prosopis alba]